MVVGLRYRRAGEVMKADMAATGVRSADDRISRELVRRGLITDEQLRKALVLQRSRGKPLVETLVEMGALPEDAAREILSERLGVPAVDLDQVYGDPMALDLLPKEKAFELKAIPLFAVENQLTVAVPDPQNLTKIDELRFITGKDILPVLALEPDIERHLKEYYGDYDPTSTEGVLEFESPTGAPIEEGVDLDEAVADRPVVRLVNLIFARAIQEDASDIHLEPQEGHMAVRYRVDGRLQPKPFQIPAAAIPAVASRIKILSGLDIAERRVPQDGKIRLRYRGRRIDVRTSTYPTIHGEKIVLRLLDKEKMDFRLDSIGMSEPVLAAWRRVLRRHEGIVLVTGPTGSGKSSTLYATLRELHRPDVNIVTLEDPVEYELPGITQAQVNDRAGFTFAKGLRAILRQDPDIILVGEIRDQETAQIAAQAALTGHLVLATLHTNDAPSSVTRLVDMGVPAYLVASTVIAVLAQRLVRRLCPHCAQDAEPGPEERELFAPWLAQGVPFREGKGCQRCLGTGYRGRTGVHELMVVSPAVRKLVAAGADEQEIAARAGGEGYRRLWWDGLEKVREAVTSLRELARVVEPVSIENPPPEPPGEEDEPFGGV